MSHKKTWDFSNVPLVSRQEARASGLKQYFTGEPCTAGHVAPRYTKFCKCVVCAAKDALAWQKRMYLNHGDEYRARRRSEKHADPIGTLIRVARARAKKKGLAFTITAIDVPLPAACPCCSQKMMPRTGAAKQGPTPQSPSIDRLDSAYGYVPGNVAVICWRCNELKRNATPDELRKILMWIEGHEMAKIRLKVVGG